MSKQNKTLKTMIFVAMYAAMAIVLDFVKEMIPFTSIWANGGSIDIGLIPLVFASFHLGLKWGVVTGLIEFVASIAIGATKLYFAAVNPVLGFLCDYIIPIAICGCACMFLGGKREELNKTVLFKMEAGIILAMAIRIFSQIVSGAYCWVDAEAAGTWESWLFSINYNGSYGLPTLIMLVIVMPLLYKAFYKQINK